MLIKLYSENPNERTVRQVVALLRDGGVIAYPTDTLYALGCSIEQPKAIERLRILRGKAEAEMSIVCSDLSMASEYARIDNQSFRTLKNSLPGPFTFILPASSRIAEKIMVGRRTVGVRIPDNAIVQALIQELGCPMVSTSVHLPEGVDPETITHPELLHEHYTQLDAVVDGGIGHTVPSTLVDLTSGEPLLIRPGAGSFGE